jgi:transposase InsO family protein
MRNVIVGAAMVVLCGTARELPASTLEATVFEVSVQDCKRVEGTELGALPLEVEVGGKTVRFAEWTTADELSTEVFGFAAQLPADVTFTVQAGERTFTSTSPRWLHPLGVAGPRTHAIDAVTFCAQSRRPALALAR